LDEWFDFGKDGGQVWGRGSYYILLTAFVLVMRVGRKV